MRAAGILQQQLERDLATIHVARLRAVFAAVYTLLRVGRLSLTSLGRAIAERTSPKHGIKRIDRLLGNRQLHLEQLDFYRAIACRLLNSAPRPVVLVDWTAVTPTLWALVAAIPFDGRAVTVYAETHPISRYLKPRTHRGFLRRLKVVLPVGCAPIVVTDAGFRSPWMRMVAKLGWNYICRIRNARVRLRRGNKWLFIAALWQRARTSATDFGQLELSKRVRHICRVVGIRRRQGALLERARRFNRSLREQRAAKEPWILATSLQHEPPDVVVGIYRRRMLIEETFRDAKSTRFGLSLSHARTTSEERANVLLLLASLAHLFALLIGIAAEALHLERRYQANTVRTRRVLSLATLGRLVAATDDGRILRVAVSARVWTSLTTRLQLALPP